jgi:hypothetical protein
LLELLECELGAVELVLLVSVLVLLPPGEVALP